MSKFVIKSDIAYIPPKFATVNKTLGRTDNKRIVATRPFFPGGAVASPTAANNWAGTSQVQHWFPAAATGIELVIGNYIYNGANLISNGGELGYGPIICSAAYVPTAGATCRQLNISNGKRYVTINPKATFRTDPDMGLLVPGGAYANFRVWTCAAPNLVSLGNVAGGTLVSGTPYFYRLTWVKDGVESLSSQELTVTPTGANLTVPITYSVGSAPVDFVKVYRGTTASSPGTMVCIAEIPGTRGTTFSDTGFAQIPGSGVCPATAQVPVYQVIPNGGANDNSNYASQSGNGSDQTLDGSGVFANAGSAFYAHIPMAFLGYPQSPIAACAIHGDSILVGVNSTTGRDSHVKKALDTNLNPYVHLAEGGTTVQHVLQGVSSGSVQTNYVERHWLINHVDYVISNFGINDVKNNRSTVQIKADLLAFWSDMAARGAKTIHLTLTPWTTSTDSWTSVGSQAVNTPAKEVVRQAINQWLRAPASAGAGNSALLDSGGNLYKVWDVDLTVEYNTGGTQIAISAVDGSITNGVGGMWAVPAPTNTGIATGGSTTTLIDTGASPVFTGLTNQWQVRFTSGLNSGVVRPVSTITGSTQINLGGAALGNAVIAGDGYIVVRNGSGDGLHPNQVNYDNMYTACTVADLIPI